MDVRRADVLGFCGGVRRAVAMLEDAAAQWGTVYTLHAIVHNRHVMEDLAAKGVRLVDHLADIPDGAAVALTAHGAPLPTVVALEARELTLIDATCPIVRQAQQTVAGNGKQKRFTVIFGDRNHLEVRGLLSQAPGLAVAAESLEGLELPLEGRFAIAAQTTKSPQSLQTFAQAFSVQWQGSSDLRIQDTTCPEPVARYQAARELASQGNVEAMVVIGSPTSANTKNLVAACRESGAPTFFLESATEIDPTIFAAYSSLGLTAGASTPDAVIDDVAARLAQL